jgi:hypothetical protein
MLTQKKLDVLTHSLTPIIRISYTRFLCHLQLKNDPKKWIRACVTCSDGEGQIVKYHPATPEVGACYEIELNAPEAAEPEAAAAVEEGKDPSEPAKSKAEKAKVLVPLDAVRLADKSVVVTPYGKGIVVGISEYSGTEIMYKVVLDWKTANPSASNPSRTVAYLNADNIVPSSFDWLFRSVRRVLTSAALTSTDGGAVAGSGAVPSASQFDELILRGSGLLSTVFSSSTQVFDENRGSLEEWIENSPLKAYVEASGIKELALQYLRLMHQIYQSIVKIVKHVEMAVERSDRSLKERFSVVGKRAMQKLTDGVASKGGQSAHNPKLQELRSTLTNRVNHRLKVKLKAEEESRGAGEDRTGIAEAMASMNTTLRTKADEAGLNKTEDELKDIMAAVQAKLEEAEAANANGGADTSAAATAAAAAKIVEEKLGGSDLVGQLPDSDKLVKALASMAQSKVASARAKVAEEAERENVANIADLNAVVMSLVQSKLDLMKKDEDNEPGLNGTAAEAGASNGDDEATASEGANTAGKPAVKVPDPAVVSAFLVDKLGAYGVDLEEGSQENETVGLLIGTLENKLHGLDMDGSRDKMDALSADIKHRLESLDLSQKSVLGLLAKKLDIGLATEAEDLGMEDGSDKDGEGKLDWLKGNALDFIQGIPILIRDVVHKDEFLKTLEIEDVLKDTQLQMECLRRCQALVATEIMMQAPKLMSGLQDAENKVSGNGGDGGSALEKGLQFVMQKLDKTATEENIDSTSDMVKGLLANYPKMAAMLQSGSEGVSGGGAKMEQMILDVIASSSLTGGNGAAPAELSGDVIVKTTDSILGWVDAKLKLVEDREEGATNTLMQQVLLYK